MAINSVGITAAIRAAILSLTPISIPGSVYVVDNPSNAPMTVGGITLPPNSVYICSYNYPAYAAWTAVTTTVNGMPATSWQISSVSQAIFSKKSLGCSYAPSCILVGSVSGTTLTVSNVSSGTLVAGQTLLNSLTGQPYTNNGANVTITGGSGTSWTLNLTPGTLTGATLWTGTTNAVVDPSYPSLPQPSYSITFTTPVQIPVNVQVTLAAASNPPSSALSLLQASTGVIAAFTGADGLLPASQIGATTYSSRFYSTVAGLLPASTVIGIQIGATAAAFNGALSGNALTVNSLTSGALAVGQTLYWTGCQGSSGTGPLPTIVSGSDTSWVISTASLTASAVAMTATVMGNSQPININQISTMGSVYLVLQ